MWDRFTQKQKEAEIEKKREADMKLNQVKIEEYNKEELKKASQEVSKLDF